MTADEKNELRQLLLCESVDTHEGIIMHFKRTMLGDLHARMAARAIELLNAL